MVERVYTCKRCGAMHGPVPGICVDCGSVDMVGEYVSVEPAESESYFCAVCGKRYIDLSECPVCNDLHPATNHDVHYSVVDIEPVTVQEQFLNHNAKDEDMSPSAAHHIVCAIKYIMRAGLKRDIDGVSMWRKDIEKAINHLHRALNGRWIGEGE